VCTVSVSSQGVTATGACHAEKAITAEVITADLSDELGQLRFAVIPPRVSRRLCDVSWMY
jgi:hypothetical protein